MRKHCKRRIYAKLNTIAYCLEGARPTAADQQEKLVMRELGSIENIVKGSASEIDWHDLNACLTICEELARANIGPEALPACEQARATLKDMAARWRDTGKMGVSGQGLQALRDLAEYHQLQRSSITRFVYETHLKKAINRTKSRAPGILTL